MHNHLMPDERVLTEYERVAEELGIEKTVFLGLEWPGCPMSCNNAIRAAMKSRPGFVVGFAGVNLWEPVDPDKIDRFRDEGFVGLKFIIPPAPYHDECFYPYYERAEKLSMPIVFHLGIVSSTGTDSVRVDNNFMRPVYLDTIARSFRGLTLIGAHLGNPWYEEAAMSARWNPNLFFDLTGSLLKKKKPSYIGELLWWNEMTAYRSPKWPGAWDQIVFGTDTAPGHVAGMIDDYTRVFDELELSGDIRLSVMSGTGRAILRAAGVAV